MIVARPASRLVATLGLGFAVAALLIGLGLWYLVGAQRFAEGAQPVAAVVLRMADHRDPVGSAGRPVLGFATPAGMPAEAVLHPGDRARGLEPGQETTVLFNPASPGTVRQPDGWSLYGTGALLLALGFGAEALLGFVLWRRVLRHGARA